MMRLISLLVLCCCWMQHGAALAARSSSASAHAKVAAAPIKTLVTGAAGRTGRLVFSKLQQDRRFSPVAMVRTDASGRKLIQETGSGLDQVVVCDVTQLKSTDPPKCVEACSKGGKCKEKCRNDAGKSGKKKLCVQLSC